MLQSEKNGRHLMACPTEARGHAVFDDPAPGFRAGASRASSSRHQTLSFINLKSHSIPTTRPSSPKSTMMPGRIMSVSTIGPFCRYRYIASASGSYVTFPPRSIMVVVNGPRDLRLYAFIFQRPPHAWHRQNAVVGSSLALVWSKVKVVRQDLHRPH